MEVLYCECERFAILFVATGGRMFLWKSLDAGVASRALTVLLRRPAAPEPAPEASAANRDAKKAEALRTP
jgi:hypothetical protein